MSSKFGVDKMNKKLISILRNASNIKDIDKERVYILYLMPELKIMIKYNQHNRAHQYNLWEHSLATVCNLPKDIDDDMLYLAALLHDIGKPDCVIYDTKDGVENYHYYGHPKRSMEIVRDTIIPGLQQKGIKFSDDDKRRLLYYVEYHDDRVSLRAKHLRKHIQMGVSVKEFQNLMHLQVADAKAHILISIVLDRIEICSILSGEYTEELYNKMIAEDYRKKK